MKRSLEISDIIILLSLGFIGTGLYYRFDIGTSLSVVGCIMLVIGVFMAPKRKV